MTSLTARVAAVKSWLATQYMLADDEWLTGCVEYISSDGGECAQQEINRLAREQWLLNDLKDVCPGSLPANLCTREKTQLGGRYVLQVNCAIDVGTPAYQQYQKLKKVNIENIEETTRHEEKIPNHRMIKLYLTDGVQEVFGVEYRTMRNLTCDITPGCKLLLKGPVDCRRGMLLLQENNVEILGGEVEDLVSANNLPAVLSRMLGVEDVGDRSNAPVVQDLLPPVQPANHTPVNVTALEDNTPRANPNRQPNRTQTTNPPNRNTATHHRPLLTNSFDRPNTGFDWPISNVESTNTASSSRPVAVVTGVPITESFCDDDIDLDLDQIAAIEEQAIKQTNKRPLWQDSRADRSNRAEKRLKTLNAAEMRANEFPCDDDLTLDEMDYFNDLEIAEESNNSIKTPSYPINMPSEPFVYIKQIKEMDEIARAGKVYHIKAQILKLLSKLSIGKEGWSLKCTLIDGTGCLDVDFTSDVLSKVVGYSPSQMSKLKKEMATDPKVKEKAVAALNAAKMRLQVLNCIVEITFLDGPKITELIDFTERHAKLLKDRLAATNL